MRFDQDYSPKILTFIQARSCTSAALNKVWSLLHGLICCCKLGEFHKGHVINSQYHRQIHRVGFNSCMLPSLEGVPSNPLLETHSNSEGKVLPENMFLPFNSHSSIPWRIFSFDILYCICIQSFCCTPSRMNIFKIPFCISGTLSRKCFSGWLGKSSLLFAILLQCGAYSFSSSKSGNTQSKQMIKKNHWVRVKHKIEQITPTGSNPRIDSMY